MKKTPMTLLTLTALFVYSGSALAGDVRKGETLFKKCAICHTIGTPEKKKIGPDLKGIVGRKAATLSSYKKYSDALVNAKLTWDKENLDRFLKAPKKMIPKTRMSFMGMKNKTDRDNLIAYLK